MSFAKPTTVDRDCSANARRVYRLRRSTDVPTAANTLATDITGELAPRVCVNALAIDPRRPLAVYAGTSKGVYRGRPPQVSRRGAPWQWGEYMQGLPRADVRDLEVHPGTKHMFAATYGRGAFEVVTAGRRRP